MKELLEQIRVGEITVKWNGWIFTARSCGNWHDFGLYRKGKECGYIKDGDNGLTIEVDGENICENLKDEQLQISLEDILMMALKRDDKELADKLTVDANGNIFPPCDNCDITREDIINGTY